MRPRHASIKPCVMGPYLGMRGYREGTLPVNESKGFCSRAPGNTKVSVEGLLQPRPPNVALLRALWSLLHGIWGVLKGSWGVLEGGGQDVIVCI